MNVELLIQLLTLLLNLLSAGASLASAVFWS